jgi:(2Fe-2S) ferredoxin
MAIKDLTLIDSHLFLCNGGTCKMKGAEESTNAIRSLIKEQLLTDKIHTTKTLCNGRCKEGPIVICQPQGLWLKNVTADIAEKLVNSYLVAGIIPESNKLFQYGDPIIYSDEPTDSNN